MVFLLPVGKFIAQFIGAAFNFALPPATHISNCGKYFLWCLVDKKSRCKVCRCHFLFIVGLWPFCAVGLPFSRGYQAVQTFLDIGIPGVFTNVITLVFGD